MSLMMICSTSHRQRGVRLLLLVAGAVLAWFLYLSEALFFFFSLSFFSLSFLSLILWCTLLRL